MPEMLKWTSRPCHRDNSAISTKNMSSSQNVMYNGYSECTFCCHASRRFPRWSDHPIEEKSARMSSLSYPTDISGLVSSRMGRKSYDTKLEPPDRLSSNLPIPTMAQCVENRDRPQPVVIRIFYVEINTQTENQHKLKTEKTHILTWKNPN